MRSSLLAPAITEVMSGRFEVSWPVGLLALSAMLAIGATYSWVNRKTFRDTIRTRFSRSVLKGASKYFEGSDRLWLRVGTFFGILWGAGAVIALVAAFVTAATLGHW